MTVGSDCCVLESVKAASDVYCPVEGTVVAVNEALRDDPSLVNTDPYAAGWLFRLRPLDEKVLSHAFDSLLTAEAYRQKIAVEDD